MKYILTVFILVSVTCCNGLNPQQKGSQPVSHELFDQLLKKHVRENGRVDYKGLQADRSQLKKYLDLLTKNAPNKQNWTEDESLAYWINVYNAHTLELVLRHYPIESIKDIGSTIQIPFVNTPWDIKFIEIAGEKYDLNNIEHGIIRKRFDEPRIHFAVNCAAISCPMLRGEAYTGEKLDEQLDQQASRFINDPSRNRITKDKLWLSKIFQWYSGDFESVVGFIDQYTDTKLNKDVKIEYLDYDWGLNDIK